MQTICIIDAGAGQKKMPLLFTPFTVTRFAMHRNHALHDFAPQFSGFLRTLFTKNTSRNVPSEQ